MLLHSLNINCPFGCVAFTLPEYHDLSSCGGAVQAVEEATHALQSLVRLTSAEDRDTAVLATVADLSYAWVLVDQYTDIMQVPDKLNYISIIGFLFRTIFLSSSSHGSYCLEIFLLAVDDCNSRCVSSKNYRAVAQKKYSMIYCSKNIQ